MTTTTTAVDDGYGQARSETRIIHLRNVLWFGLFFLQNSGDRFKPIAVCILVYIYIYIHFTNCISPYNFSSFTSLLIHKYWAFKRCSQLLIASDYHIRVFTFARIFLSFSLSTCLIRIYIAFAFCLYFVSLCTRTSTNKYISSYPEWALWCLLPI